MDLEGRQLRFRNRVCVPGFASVDGLATQIPALLDDIQQSMLDAATAFRDARLHEASTYDDLKEIVGAGWALIWHCSTPECEDRIKEETKAGSRCYPLDINEEWYPDSAKCTICGEPAFGKAWFARAY